MTRTFLNLIPQFVGHDVSTVQSLGWAGIENGDLLERAGGTIDVFVTMDRKLERCWSSGLTSDVGASSQSN